MTKEEVESTLKAEAARLNMSSLALKNKLAKEKMFDSVLAMIKHRKVFDFIISQAQIGVETPKQGLITPETIFQGESRDNNTD